MVHHIARVLIPAGLLLVAATAAAHDGQKVNFVVESVVPDGAAANAGLEVDDSILRIGGQALEAQADLKGALDAHRPGDTVPIVVDRGGEELTLELTFLEGPTGGASLGISVAIAGQGTGPGDAFSGPTLTRDECVIWVDETYSIEARVRELDLGFEEDAKRLLSCLESDIQGMPSPMPVGWCDNAFKIHCSGLGLLTEVGEGQVEGCEELLGETLSSCAAQKVFDRYSENGQVSDRAACIAARDACSEDQS